MRLAWRWGSLGRNLPYVREGGVGLDVVVIFVPVLGAVLIRQALGLLVIQNPIWVYGVRTAGFVPEHNLQDKKTHCGFKKIAM